MRTAIPGKTTETQQKLYNTKIKTSHNTGTHTSIFLVERKRRRVNVKTSKKLMTADDTRATDRWRVTQINHLINS